MSLVLYLAVQGDHYNPLSYTLTSLPLQSERGGCLGGGGSEGGCRRERGGCPGGGGSERGCPSGGESKGGCPGGGGSKRGLGTIYDHCLGIIGTGT